MAKGYPSRRRARKAFEWGFKIGQRFGPEAHLRRRYRNPRLAVLYERGFVEGAKRWVPMTDQPIDTRRRQPRDRRVGTGRREPNGNRW